MDECKLNNRRALLSFKSYIMSLTANGFPKHLPNRIEPKVGDIVKVPSGGFDYSISSFSGKLLQKGDTYWLVDDGKTGMWVPKDKLIIDILY